MRRRGERETTCGFRRGPDGSRMAVARLDREGLLDLLEGGAVILALPLDEGATEQLLVLICSPYTDAEALIEMAKALEGWKPGIPLTRRTREGDR